MAAVASVSDLTQCDLEPIRWPGAIQPHGRMLVLHGQTLAPVACSAQWPDAQRDAVLAALDVETLAALPPGGSPVGLGRLQPSGMPLIDVAAHRTPAHVVVECEPATAGSSRQDPLHALVRDFLPRLQRAQTRQELCELAAGEIRRLTGFGRALVYCFDEDGHGQVLAESLQGGYDSYLGHHFPATDIPQQARALYQLNRFRLIPDARYDPVALETVDGSAAREIDLSQAFLRSVSPVHLEYMRNMGTLASMSVSILVEGRLWGLISCHDHDPRHLPAQTRVACEHLGQLLALQLEAKESNADAAQRLELRKLTLAIVAYLADTDASLQRLAQHPGLLRMAGATGAAVVLDDAVWSTGEVPAAAQIEELARWIVGLGVEAYDSDELARHFAPAAAYAERAAGVLAISISQVHRHVILWFRPEIVRTVRWAGDPRKSVDENGRIQPRRSFASWTEQIRGRCARWTPAETGAVRELREALIGIVLQRAEEMAAVATELGRVNKELEAFSYTVSHDLRAPMRHIAGYVDLVLQLEGTQIGARGQRYLGHVKEAAAFAGQLVDALLDFSRMGRAALKPRGVDTAVMVRDLVRELARLETGRTITWDIAPDLPRLHADPFLLQVATRNLLANALKYTRKREDAHIAVRSVRRPEGEGLEVQDNGVGFEMQYVAKLFGVFQRLHAAEEFEGTGIGLANVKRIVERHGGSVWARGAPGAGAAFGFTLPQEQPNNIT
ncbi:ATP-binding protein [Pseudorhodoferax sp. Leaf267]|uniref:ATP-binding protein n=1 Tax=Pseudorhodoferax sp. Leaf267 TaxID=1736316 RepID=UPI0006F7ABAD|nr:ATP-binding protein [Pseudorhodoferax sp. Leaf267]KQP15054.1 histidine kinase [Pseudorhodoferax sp. Leaf267]